MRAWLADFGGGADSLRRVELPEPVPGKGEVLIQVETVTLNRRDQNILDGRYPLPVKPTLVPGCDAVGTVIGSGPDVGGVRVGDRVVLAVFPKWPDGSFSMRVAAQLGGSLDGVLRERLCWPASAVVRVPDGLDPLQAACLPCAGVTAWHALELLELDAGEAVVSTSTGNVSIYAVQFAAARRFIPHLLSARADRVRELESAGIAAHHGPPMGEVAGAVHTFGNLNETLELLAVGGRIGLVSPAGGTPVDPVRLFARNIQLRSLAVGSVAHTQTVVENAARHDIRIPVTAIIDFKDVPRAFAEQSAARHPGKVAVTVSP